MFVGFLNLNRYLTSSVNPDSTSSKDNDELKSQRQWFQKYATATDIDTKNLVLFFVIAYAYTWIIWFGLLGLIKLLPDVNPWALLPFGLIGAAGPLFSSMLLTYKYEGGWTAVKAFWKRGVQLKTIPLWIWFAMVLVYVLQNFITGYLVAPDDAEIDYIGLALFVPIFILVYIGGPVQEEYGWRGYALDRLQTKYSALVSSIIVGVLWGFWHLPLFYISLDPHSDMNLWYFVLENVGSSMVYSWLYNQSQSNITVAILIHMANNSVSYIFTLDSAVDSVALAYALILIAFGLFVITPIFGYKTFTNVKCQRSTQQ